MKYSAVAEKRVAGGSPSNCPANTLAYSATGGGLEFPRRSRLTRRQDLQAVIREGKRIQTVHLDARVLASPLDCSRVGIVVPRHKQSAVARNKLKRRLRELARLKLLPAMATRTPSDFVIRARPEAYRAEFAELGADVDTIVERVRRRETKAAQ